MVVKFKNIGRGEHCFESECKSKLTREWLIKQIKPYIFSSDISFINMDNGNVAVFVGQVRQVGEIEIVEG